jgi:hypothetical protein
LRETKEKKMVVVPLPNPAVNSPAEPDADRSKYWLKVAAGGSLVASGILLLSGKHRAALLAAITGTALTMVDQQETVRTWWESLPGLIDNAGRMLNQVQGVVENVDSQRAKLRALVGK